MYRTLDVFYHQSNLAMRIIHSKYTLFTLERLRKKHPSSFPWILKKVW
jgi:hypothetical protein